MRFSLLTPPPPTSPPPPIHATPSPRAGSGCEVVGEDLDDAYYSGSESEAAAAAAARAADDDALGPRARDIFLRVSAPPNAFRFTVIAVEPFGAAACALFSGFAQSVDIEFLPAQDDEAVTAAAPRAGLAAAAAAAAAPSPRGTRFADTGNGLADDTFGALPGVAAPAEARTSRGINTRPLAFDAAAALPPPTASASATPRDASPRADAAGAGAGAAAPAPAQPTQAERRRLAAEAAMRRAAAAAASAAAATGSAAER
jgi:hypothetical protein